MTTGIIVFAHGSRIEPANQAVRRAAADLARVGDCPNVEAAFLELGRPSLEEATDLLVARGVERIVIIPYFLSISNKNNSIRVHVTASLDGHPGLVAILAERARAAMVEPLALK
ncbi:MAG: CbiX/SirB N-terminal domain-containing protein [Candidatus Solibacter sp.]|nr:CbiX/SirB N-terminal domain-containing protein [Candidatus Solibacter sp.]